MKKYPLPALNCRQDLVINLQFMYSLILATESLLEVGGFHERLEEERGHAEWLKNDLLAMGEAIPIIDHDAACIAGAQYYYINHVDRRMLLGYMLAMEGDPMPLEIVDAIEAQWGAVPVLRHHAIADIDHGADVQSKIDAIDDEILKKKIMYNAESTACLIQAVLQKRVNHG